MSFVVRIFFSGLIAFVPSGDGHKMTVLLPQAHQGYTASDRSRIEPHQALLLARAADCKGDCRNDDPAIAAVLFPDRPKATALESLAVAVRDGAAWRLDGVDLALSAKGTNLEAFAPLRIRRGSEARTGVRESVPGTSAASRDFDWVADLGRIVPSSGVVDPALLKPVPPEARIAARLGLRFGEISTYRLVRVGGEVLPLHFKTLEGGAAETSYSQALADLVMAEIQVPNGELEVVASAFGQERKRSIKLTPENGVLEIVLLNVPQSHFNLHAGEGEAHQEPEPGKHFEMYYDLAKVRPSSRPVPFPVSSATPARLSPHGREETGSKLLEALRFGSSHGIYERVICPVAQLSAGGEP